MKKAYVIFPTVAMLIFFGIWWNFNSKYEAVQLAKAQKARAELDAKKRKDAADREVAIKDAIAAQEKRKKEREAKEAKDRADREAREVAIENRDKVYRDKERLAKQKDRLIADVKTEKESITKLEEQKRKLIGEEAFLRNYVTQAEANAKALTAVLDKIAAADKARADAEAAALAAKKNS